MGNKGPVLRPRCIGPRRDRTQIPFNSIPKYKTAPHSLQLPGNTTNHSNQVCMSLSACVSSSHSWKNQYCQLMNIYGANNYDTHHLVFLHLLLRHGSLVLGLGHLNIISPPLFNHCLSFQYLVPNILESSSTASIHLMYTFGFKYMQ
jgi:hypothetical protein